MNDTRETSAGAVCALVFGILGMLSLGLLALPAIICGHLSRSKIRKSGGRLTGDGMATAGMVLGYIALGIGIICLGLPLCYFIIKFISLK